jgi:hypothetical protein
LSVNGFSRRHFVSIGGLSLLVIGVYFFFPKSNWQEASLNSILLSDPISVQQPIPMIQVDNAPLPVRLPLNQWGVGKKDSLIENVTVPSMILDAVLMEQSQGGTGEKTLTPWLAAKNIMVSPSWQRIFEALKVPSKDHYTLQLAILPSLALARRWIEDRGLSSAWIYPDIGANKTEYVVILGDFSTKNQAHQIEAKLHHQFESLQIDLRTYAQIQKALANVKKIIDKA